MTSFKKRKKLQEGRKIRERREWREEEEESVALTTSIKGSNKPPPATKTNLLSFEDEVVEGEEFKVKKSSLSKKLIREREAEERKQQEERLIKEALEDDGEGEGEEKEEESVLDRLHAGIVPDALMIHNIRKKRQLERERGGDMGGARGRGIEYLSLNKDDKKGYKVASGKSRLIREDENDKSDEEDEEEMGVSSRHMTFGKKTEPGRQFQVLSALDNLDSGSEDEETQRWEEEQINKGMKASNPQTVDRVQEEMTLSSLDPLTQSFIYGTEYYNQFDVKASHAPPIAPPPPVSVKFLPITLDSLKSRLSTRLIELKDDMSNHERQLEQVIVDLKEATDYIDRAGADYPELEEHYVFYQQMKGYLKDLLSCLAIKGPVIRSLEFKVQSIRLKRSRLLISRRRQDVRDEAEDCRGLGGAVGDDEAHQVRSVEREGRRRRRRERREKEEVTDHNEGMSSDDEILESDRINFKKELDSVDNLIDQVFSDVVDDFCDLTVIKTRFEQWKFTQPTSYQQAYVSLCLPKVFAPYARHEMIHWNPLEADAIPIESMSWIQCLLSYGYREGVGLGEEPDLTDDDTHLIPQLIDRVVLSKIIGSIQYVWDPLSSSQTQCLMKTLRYLQEEFPASSPQTNNQQEVLANLAKRFQESLSEDSFIPLLTKSQLESTNTHAYSFYQRQFWSSMKLLGNILCCRGILPDSVIHQLVFDGLISRYILLSLQNSPINELTVFKLSRLLHSLPCEWLKRRADNGNHGNSRVVESLKRYLAYLIEKMDTKEMSLSSEQQKKENRQLKSKLLALQLLLTN